MKIHVTLFISFLFSIGFAQEQFKFRRFTTDDGLPTNSIYAITEDRKGNLVLGTDNGLTFFDGTDFKTLNVKDGLINPYIVGLTNDEKGNIWFINYGGKLQKIVNNKISTTNVFTEYYNQITNTNNKIYLFTSQRWNKNKQYTSIGISKYNNYRIDTDTLNRNPKIAPQILSQNNEIIELHNNTLHYKKNVIALPKEVKFIHKVIFRNKVVYILEDTKLYVLDHKSVLIHTIKLPQSLSANRFYKYDFIVDPQENCWLSIQGKGLFLLKNNKWISIQESLGLSSNDNINFLYCDKKGRLWIATNEKGLFCIPTVFIQNIRFKNVENNFNSFATSADQKSLFIATNFKLYSYEKDQIHFLEESLLPIKIDNLGSTPIYYFPYHQNLPQDKKLKILTKTSGRQVIKKNGSKYYSLFSLSSLVTANDNDSKELFIENKVRKKEKIRNIVYHKNEYYFNNYHKINIRTFDDKNIYEKRELKFKIKGFIEDFTFINDTMWVAASDVVYKIFNEKIIDSITSVNTIKLEDVQKIKPIGNDVFLCLKSGFLKFEKINKKNHTIGKDLKKKFADDLN